MTSRRVVVTGRGIVSPLGVGVDAHFAALMEGACAVGPLPRLASLGLPASRGAQVDPDVLRPNLARLPRKQQKLYNRATLLGMLAASLAMDEAGLRPGAGDPERFGIVLGVNALSWDLGAMVEYLTAAESRQAPGTLDMAVANAFCVRNINPLDYSLKTLPNLAAGHLAIAHDAQGICRAMTEGPVGGGHAIGQAFRMIAEGDLDVALCGGADALLEEMLFASHLGAGIFAPDGPAEAGARPGEGSGVLVLEEAARARARGAPIHGEVRGFAIAAGDGELSSDDGERLGKRLERVIAQVVREAGTAPDVVSLHADGIASHELAERAAIEGALGGTDAVPTMVRMKDSHGDLGAASAPVEFLACSVALKRAILPRTVVNRSHDAPLVMRRALVISLGLFGECAALMLAEPGGGYED